MNNENDITKLLEDNPNLMIDLVYEFFEGKYSKEEVDKYLFGFAKKSVRHGVDKLSEEFNAITDKNTDSIKKWYTDTDFYIFDLLPYNGGYMYRDKVKEVKSLIDTFNFKSILDFGAGLGIGCIYWAQNTNVDVYYVDLKNSVTSKFARFLANKFNVTNIKFMNDEEFFKSNISVDLITALDCFEHIPNMEEIFDKLVDHSNVIFHDSTFYSDEVFPQHVYTPSILEFLNMCALRNYIPRNNSKLLWRAYLQFNKDSQLSINFI